jgi:hypothetical protein
MEYFISLFPRLSCHQKCFETVNETTPKIYDFKFFGIRQMVKVGVKVKGDQYLKMEGVYIYIF